jgi:hypothetical protein
MQNLFLKTTIENYFVFLVVFCVHTLYKGCQELLWTETTKLVRMFHTLIYRWVLLSEVLGDCVVTQEKEKRNQETENVYS